MAARAGIVRKHYDAAIADTRQLARLREGPAAWNAWRSKSGAARAGAATGLKASR